MCFFNHRWSKLEDGQQSCNKCGKVRIINICKQQGHRWVTESIADYNKMIFFQGKYHEAGLTLQKEKQKCSVCGDVRNIEI